MFNKHFLWLFQNVSILTEPGTNHDASLFLRASSLSCRTIFTGRNRRFPCCIRPDQNTPGQTKAPFSPRNAEKRVQVNAFAWPCQNRHSPVRSPQALSSEKLRSAVLSEVLDGTDHLRGVGVLVVVPGHDLNLIGVVAATLNFCTFPSNSSQFRNNSYSTRTYRCRIKTGLFVPQLYHVSASFARI